MIATTNNLDGCYAVRRKIHTPKHNTDRFRSVQEIWHYKILGVRGDSEQPEILVYDDAYYGLRWFPHNDYCVEYLPDAKKLFYWHTYAIDINTGEYFDVESDGDLYEDTPIQLPDFI